MTVKSYLKPSIALNRYLYYFVFSFLILTIIVLSTPSNAVSPENSNNRAASPFPELNYTEGEITVAQIEFDGIKREFRYYVPKNFSRDIKHPLILVLHGYNQPIDTIISGYSSMHLKADTDGTIIIYPVGSMEEKNLAWNTKYGSSQDPLVPEWGLSGDRFGVVPMVDNIHYWKNRNKISETAQVSDLPDLCEEITDKMPTPSKIKKYVWKGPNHNDMIWLNVINGGHWLPGYFDGKAIDPGTFELKMGTWNCDYDAAAGIYDFFVAT
jgi:poly(3-hydroxybutyrate) depolymerase